MRLYSISGIPALHNPLLYSKFRMRNFQNADSLPWLFSKHGRVDDVNPPVLRLIKEKLVCWHSRLINVDRIIVELPVCVHRYVFVLE